jgi:uncharacterized protein YbjT (DUF2867 family)
MTTISVIGSTGTTGRPLTRSLRSAGVTVRATSRNPREDTVHFDWNDPSTHHAALDGADGVYVIAPVLTLDPRPVIDPFLDLARQAAVPRLVLLGSLAVLPDAPGLAAMAATVRDEPGWTVLRPSGFMQNLIGTHPVATHLRDHGQLLSAGGTGRLGWIDADDIAAAAHAALLAPAVQDEYVLTGPESLSYHDTAKILHSHTGRVTAVADITVTELATRFRSAGMPDAYATSLAHYNGAVQDGVEDAVTTAVADLTGRPRRSFAEFVRLHSTEFTGPVVH